MLVKLTTAHEMISLIFVYIYIFTLVDNNKQTAGGKWVTNLSPPPPSTFITWSYWHLCLTIVRWNVLWQDGLKFNVYRIIVKSKCLFDQETLAYIEVINFSSLRNQNFSHEEMEGERQKLLSLQNNSSSLTWAYRTKNQSYEAHFLIFRNGFAIVATSLLQFRPYYMFLWS